MSYASAIEAKLARIERKLDQVIGKPYVEQALNDLVEALEESNQTGMSLRFHDSGNATLVVREVGEDGKERRFTIYKERGAWPRLRRQ